MRDGEEGEGCLRSQFSEWNRFWGSAEPSGWVERETQRDRKQKKEILKEKKKQTAAWRSAQTPPPKKNHTEQWSRTWQSLTWKTNI